MRDRVCQGKACPIRDWVRGSGCLRKPLPAHGGLTHGRPNGIDKDSGNFGESQVKVKKCGPDFGYVASSLELLWVRCLSEFGLVHEEFLVVDNCEVRLGS